MKKLGCIIILLLLLSTLVVFTAGCSVIKEEAKSTGNNMGETEEKLEDNSSEQENNPQSNRGIVIDAVEMDPIDEMELDDAFILKCSSVLDASVSDEMDGKAVSWMYSYCSQASYDEALDYFEKLLNDLSNKGEIEQVQSGKMGETDGWYMYGFETDEAYFRIGIMSEEVYLAFANEDNEEDITFSFDFDTIINVAKELKAR
jgi:hypothetical protein